MEAKVYSVSGKASSAKANLSDEVFGIEPNNHAIYLDVKQHLANRRQGTHKSKERNEIAGSTKKLKKQKGTGGARAGSAKSGTRVGGGRIFGPRPRTYGIKLNKKVARLARKSALTSKAKAGSIIVIEDIKWDAPKTKNFTGVLNGLDLAGRKSVFVIAEDNQNVYLSSRNVQKTKVMRAQDLSTYDVMNSGTLVISEGAIEKIKATFAN